jgi:hypothetical protein
MQCGVIELPEVGCVGGSDPGTRTYPLVIVPCLCWGASPAGMTNHLLAR